MQAEVHGRQQNMETGLCQSALPQSGISEQTPALPAVRQPSLVTPYSFTSIYVQPRDSRHQVRCSGYKGESDAHSQNTRAGLLTCGRSQPLPSHGTRNRHSSERHSSNPGQASLAAGLSTQWSLQTDVSPHPAMQPRTCGKAGPQLNLAYSSSPCSN